MISERCTPRLAGVQVRTHVLPSRQRGNVHCGGDCGLNAGVSTTVDEVLPWNDAF
jgi:hypothetical protein